MSVFLVGPVLDGLAEQRKGPAFWNGQEPVGVTLTEAALFVYKYLMCSGWVMAKKVVGEVKAGASLWVSCCWALRSGPSTVH